MKSEDCLEAGLFPGASPKPMSWASQARFTIPKAASQNGSCVPRGELLCCGLSTPLHSIQSSTHRRSHTRVLAAPDAISGARTFSIVFMLNLLMFRELIPCGIYGHFYVKNSYLIISWLIRHFKYVCTLYANKSQYHKCHLLGFTACQALW